MLLLTLLACCITPRLQAQGTAFTYQGRLNGGGGPANGSYDFMFTLFTTNANGSPLAGPLTNAATAVSNGLFTAAIDFGNTFDGTARWLELAVRANGASAFTTLAPRQQITPAPYALFAGIASAASNVLGNIPVTQITGTLSTNLLPGFQPNYNTISGGTGNSAGPSYATVGGGQGNTVNNTYGVVGGGYANSAGYFGTVPGGYNNVASGNDSFAAGSFARAQNQGAFVWADSQGTTFASSANDTFNVRAQGGVNFQTGTSGVSVNGQPLLANNAAGVALNGTFTGNGANVTNVNAVALNGLNATNFWQLGGNTGANPTNGAFLGTKDNQPMEFRVNYSRALRLDYARDFNYGGGSVPNIVGGCSANLASNGLAGCFIGGGGGGLFPNRAGGNYASILGGGGNGASGEFSTAMGVGATASGNYSTAMGSATTANGIVSTAMGNGTKALGDNSTAMGNVTTASGLDSTAIGHGTTASGDYSTAMGYNTTASGDYSTAMGTGTTASGIESTAMGAYATDVFNGTACNNAFVWGDGSHQSVAQGANTFNVLATGGVWFFTGPYPDGVKLAANATSWSTISDQNVKKNFQAINGEEVLDKLASVPVQKWNYQWEKDSDVPNIGPMAQAFKNAFYPGRDDKSITTLEFDGVELAAIQGLNEKLEAQRAQNVAKNAEITELKQQLSDLKALVEKLAQPK